MTDRSVRVLLSGEMRQLQQELRRTGAEAKKTAQEAEAAFKKTGSSLDEQAAKAKRSADQQAAISRRVADMRRQEQVEAGRTATLVGQGAMALQEYRSEWDQVSTSALRAGAVLAATAVIVGKAAMDWQSQWAGVLKTADTDDPLKLNRLEGDLRGLAKSLPESHKNIAATAEAAGQLGVATDDVAAFTRIMVMLGDTTDLTSEQAATSIAQLMNVMQTAPGEVGNLGAALVALGNDGASTESQIIQMAQRIAGAGEIVGLTEAQVLGVANALASSGIEVEAGGSAMSAVLIKMENAVASGGDKLSTFAKVADTSASDFAAKWKADPSSALADFTEGLGRMSDEGGNVFATLDKLGMSDIRVTRAMLNMANSGDMLRESLALGSKAYAENSALTEEAAKRYDTTAAQAEVAWNNIKDNAIDAGQGLLPVVSGISDAIVGLADVFGSLPGPVKSSLGTLAGGAGVSLLVAGGFMKMAGAIADNYSALARLNAVAPGVGGKLGALAKGAGIAAAALVGLRVIGDLIDTDDVASVEEFTEAIIRLDGRARAFDDVMSNSQSLTARAKGFSELASAIDESDPGWLNDKFGSLFGVIKMNPYADAKEDVEQYDRALTSLAESGATDQAEKGYNAFAKAARESGKSTEDIEKLLPGYTAALKKVSNEQEIATQRQQEFVESNAALSMVLATLDPDLEKAREKLAGIQEKSRDAAMGFLDFTGGLDLSKASLRDWMAELDDMAKAQANWVDNVVVAMNRGIDEGVIAKFKELGPAGAQMLDQLVDGSQADIDRLNAIYGDFTGGADMLAALDEIPPEIITQFKASGEKGAMEKAAQLTNEYDLVPDTVESILRALGFNKADIKAWRALLDSLPGSKETKITAKDLASGAIRAVQDALSSLTPYKRITIETHRVNTGGGKGGSGRQTYSADGNFFDGGQVKAFANGGWDELGRSVPRTPQMRDSGKGTVMWGEAETGWEAYISGKPGMEARNRDILAMAAQRLGGVVAFADGGFTEALSTREYASLQARESSLIRSLREKEKYGKGGKKSRLALRGWERREAAAELREVRAEIAEQDRIRTQIGKGKKYRTAGAYNQAKEAQQKAAEERTSAAESAKSDRQSTAASFASGLDSDAFNSPASLERSLNGLLRDSADFTQLLADLRKAGASPWLLEQIIKAGPSRTTNRTLRGLLADTAKLQRLNKVSGSIVSTANSYAALTTGAGFTAAYSGSAGVGDLSAAVATAVASAKWHLSIDGRQAGVLTQVGLNYARSNG